MLNKKLNIQGVQSSHKIIDIQYLLVKLYEGGSYIKGTQRVRPCWKKFKLWRMASGIGGFPENTILECDNRS